MFEEVQDQVGFQAGREMRGRIIDQLGQGGVDVMGFDLEQASALLADTGYLGFAAAVLLADQDGLIFFFRCHGCASLSR